LKVDDGHLKKPLRLDIKNPHQREFKKHKLLMKSFLRKLTYLLQ